MLSKEGRKFVGSLSSQSAEALSARIAKRLGLGRHSYSHVQIQAILSADPQILEEEINKFARELVARGPLQ